MMEINLQTEAKQKEPEIYNIVRFIKEINKPFIIKLLHILNDRPLTYSDVAKVTGFTNNASGNKFAYHLRRARKINIIDVDPRTKQYYLTFKGIKAFELIESVNKIANLRIDNIENATTKIIVDLNRNKGWLKPLIEYEIHEAVKQLTKRRKSSL